MIGHIESYDPKTQSGVIKSEDKFFAFDLQGWVADVPPDQGDDVDFDVAVDNTTAHTIKLVGAYLQPPKAVKYKYVASALALFLGFTGAHRFYLGFYKLGIAQLALTALTVGYGALWGFVEAVLLFTGNINKDAKGRPLK
ncbi:MAG: TM2 domain-containing protein [Methylococcaceae bacterium]|nr:TM2 domain-containing protein [Methylococcaceae bacterium]MDD1609802.1 TM2 domain-containing protein [Methylococcaceae bacterium]MDD1616872.1 TM2 domain-containing protein [Methylococcaceae bacterium]OYV16618.1 MAG: TM2 domain-containing protein [Methylococcaceae bacterium NSP1-2]